MEIVDFFSHPKSSYAKQIAILVRLPVLHGLVKCKRLNLKTLISEGHSKSRGGRFKCQKPKEAFENDSDNDDE